MIAYLRSCYPFLFLNIPFSNLVVNPEVKKLFLIPYLFDREVTLSDDLECDLKISADLAPNAVDLPEEVLLTFKTIKY